MLAKIKLWGATIGSAAIEEDGVCAFEYDPAFRGSGIEAAPLTMPLGREVFRFPGLSRESFHGLPGLLADSLPDKFGNALIDAWLAAKGRTASSFNAIERLCYTGSRGMGALEFEPSRGPERKGGAIEVDRMVELASEVLSSRGDLSTRFGADDGAALGEILKIGTSAGGARAKAVVAWHPESGEVRSGQIKAGSGFEPWLIKFDGVRSNRDKELDDPKGYCALEYAYHLMAAAAGIEMNPCRLLEENGRRHFMTRRFDRTQSGEKLHMQSLAALGHYDFNLAAAHSYEQAFLVMRQLGLGMDETEQQFRRMCFNVVARNQDDHVKNIAFLMDREGKWYLSPAFDVTYSHNPQGAWTSSHQMTINGKRDEFGLDDFTACARSALMKRGRAKTILKEVCDTVRRWPDFAGEVGLPPEWSEDLASQHRLDTK